MAITLSGRRATAVIALAVGVLVGGPTRAAAACSDIPGQRYPLIDWRAFGHGSLPQTHTYDMGEDRLTFTIEDGASQGLKTDEMTIVLRSAGAWMWKKEIAAVNNLAGTVASVFTETWRTGPAAMRIRRAALCSNTTDAQTIVFRKIDGLGWFMRDMYHFDVDHFWSTLGGKIVTVTWVDDTTDPQGVHLPNYLSPRTVPFDRNLAAVSSALSSNTRETQLFQNANGWLQRFWTRGFGWVEEHLGYRSDPFTSAPGAASRVPFAPDVFIRNASNLIDTWSQGAFGPFFGEVTSSPAVASWGLDRLDVVARGTDFALWHRARNGSQWSGWMSLGGVLTSSPAIVTRGFNQLDVFARGTDNALWTRSWNGTSWGNWTWLDGVLTSDPAAVVYAPQKIAVFARGTDNALWMKTFSNGAWGWWVSLGGVLTSAPAVTSSRAEQMEIFARGADGQVYRRALEFGRWSAWAPVALPVCGNC